MLKCMMLTKPGSNGTNLGIHSVETFRFAMGDGVVNIWEFSCKVHGSSGCNGLVELTSPTGRTMLGCLKITLQRYKGEYYHEPTLLPRGGFPSFRQLHLRTGTMYPNLMFYAVLWIFIKWKDYTDIQRSVGINSNNETGISSFLLIIQHYELE
jgi:hypothetical protein